MSESTYRHSTARVPRLYKEAGKIVQKVREEGGSFKGLVFQSKHRCLKSLYALVAETLRNGKELDALLRKTGMLLEHPRLDPWIARVLITELVWRQRALSGPAIPLQIVQSYRSQLLSEQADTPSQLIKPVSRASRPRFVRINTLKASAQEVLDYFTNEGWNAVEIPTQHTSIAGENQYKNFLKRISTLAQNEFLQDLHIPNLLIFPGSMEFYKLEYYHNGSLILQDKASCVSAYLLDAPPGSTVLDMCAAPGMKTIHIAATLENRGTVYAVEKHPDRYESLCNIVSQSGASCVKPILGSAFHVSEKELPNVEYIVVDPTCSGSGMTNRREIFNDSEDVSNERLEKLSAFQCAILLHAMTKFPKVKRIVYSTCSICPEENEAVVEKVLKTTLNFKPVIPSRGTDWMKRGSSSYYCGEYGLYARPDIDMTNGFFVVVFERTVNEYVSGEIISRQGTEPRIKKKKSKAPSSKSENGSQPEATNPAFERMKKAMGSLCEAAEKESAELQTKDTSKKTKKKRKTCAEEHECAGSSVESLGNNGKERKRNATNVQGDEEKPVKNTSAFCGETDDNSLLGKKGRKRNRNDLSQGSIDTANGIKELSQDLPKIKKSYFVDGEHSMPNCGVKTTPSSPEKSTNKKKKKKKDVSYSN